VICFQLTDGNDITRDHDQMFVDSRAFGFGQLERSIDVRLHKYREIEAHRRN